MIGALLAVNTVYTTDNVSQTPVNNYLPIFERIMVGNFRDCFCNADLVCHIKKKVCRQVGNAGFLFGKQQYLLCQCTLFFLAAVTLSHSRLFFLFFFPSFSLCSWVTWLSNRLPKISSWITEDNKEKVLHLCASPTTRESDLQAYHQSDYSACGLLSCSQTSVGQPKGLLLCTINGETWAVGMLGGAGFLYAGLCFW